GCRSPVKTRVRRSFIEWTRSNLLRWPAGNRLEVGTVGDGERRTRGVAVRAGSPAAIHAVRRRRLGRLRIVGGGVGLAGYAAAVGPGVDAIDIVLGNGRLRVFHHQHEMLVVGFVEFAGDRRLHTFLINTDLGPR